VCEHAQAFAIHADRRDFGAWHHLRATFDLLIQALPNKTIAKRLGLSEATVRSYISEIFAALGYTNRGELTITAIKAGY
jgi:DNA-binding NarL/FixJ family response regulator